METPIHVIDVRTVRGLLDLIAIGNIIEFATALDHRTYENVIVDNDERLEQEAAMTRYRTFISWFSKRYGLLIDGVWLNPSYLFKRRLISFGSTLGKYFSLEHSYVQPLDRIHGITPSGVKKMIRRHIEHFWCDLLPSFDQLTTDPSPVLYYVGPPIKIIEKTPESLAQASLLGCREQIDYQNAPIYLMLEAARNAVPPSVIQSAKKREHVPTSPTNSPSTSKTVKRRK
jgi:hypothetical protein